MTTHMIFDLDGTLVDSCATCVAILTEMRAERGVHEAIDPVVARKYMSRGGTQMVAALLGPVCVDPVDDLADFRQRYRQRDTPVETLFPGVMGGLNRLHSRGITLAICSNKPQALCDKVLDDTGLAPFFASVVGGRPDLRPKPEADLLHAVLSDLDADARNCLFVGDSELDHRVAQAAVMPFVFMTYGYADEAWAPGNCDIFDCFETMTSMVVARRLKVDVRASRAA